MYKSLNNSIKEILQVDKVENPVLGSDKLQKRKRCNDCTGDRDAVKKTLYCRVKCSNPICDNHRVMCCANCIQ